MKLEFLYTSRWHSRIIIHLIEKLRHPKRLSDLSLESSGFQMEEGGQCLFSGGAGTKLLYLKEQYK